MTQQQYILPAVIGEYLEELKVIRHCSPLTLEAYALDLSQFCQNLDKDKKLNTVSSADVQCWVIQLHAAGNAASSIGRKLSALRAFYDWAILHEKLPELSTNPAKQVRRPRIKRPLPKALTVEQALVFAQSAAHNKEPDPECDPCIAERDQAMIGLLYDCGLRRAELIALDYRFIENKHYRSQAWIDCAACEVHVKGKGNKSRVLPLGRQTLSEISSWLALRHQMLSSANASSEALFLGKHGARISASAVAQALKNRSRNRATGKIHPHMLRHSFASHILQSSSDLRGVQELLGHERIATTQIYTRLDFHHLSDAYAKAHPRAKRETR